MSGNIFRDLGLPNADVLLAKSELGLGIRDLISEKGLSVEDAAVIAGMEPAALLGALERPHRSGLSIERFDKIYEALIEVPERKP
ncbi:XRE family transcriptional regulator [Mesorhizobium sp. M8A.F.Ca.ET.207.01.1.1]|uniref:XRE family transcriptional regulator n=1 Tax=Mesorhizobium sp. M8A.F.Ca.ET.207.01.1.1 TaxID=2563968 RepID=UPI001676C0D8|nr:XRE family transcriptional regulator [Mesorhizobium sp. M8A.F.Ca.ET.207.01.1.1]